MCAVGIDAQRDRAGPVAPLRQLLAQDLGRVRLGEDPGFEIQAGRQVEIGMRRTREAIAASVLAAPVGVERLLERDVGRRVAGDDAARDFLVQLGLRRR